MIWDKFDKLVVDRALSVTAIVLVLLWISLHFLPMPDYGRAKRVDALMGFETKCYQHACVRDDMTFADIRTLRGEYPLELSIAEGIVLDYVCDGKAENMIALLMSDSGEGNHGIQPSINDT